jgi:Amyotrophic lateral sclerosis 2 chromosomal region candidate gene 8
VRAKIDQLCASGVRRLPEMRRHLRHYVVDDIFGGQQPPSETDARFWPNSTAVLNCMYRASVSARYVFARQCLVAPTQFVNGLLGVGMHVRAL